MDVRSSNLSCKGDITSKNLNILNTGNIYTYNNTGGNFTFLTPCYSDNVSYLNFGQNGLQSSSLFYRDTKNRREKIKIEVRSLSNKTESRLRYVKGPTHHHPNFQLILSLKICLHCIDFFAMANSGDRFEVLF